MIVVGPESTETPSPALGEPEAQPGKSLSPAALARRRFLRNRPAVIGAALLIILACAAIFAPLITSYSPTHIDLENVLSPPSSAHWLGTDSTGRDEFSRMLYGGRVSLSVGLLTGLAVYLIGTVVGVFAGWYGGWIDQLLMRVADLFLSIPPVLVVIVIAGVLGPNLPLLIALIAAFSWPNVARIARGSVLSLREQEYVLAAMTVGARGWRIVFRHLVPAVMPPVIVASTLLAAQAILLEAALSFIGVGVQPPTPSWGNMLTDAQSITVISSQPWLWLPPGIAIVVTVLSVTFLGDGIGDATNTGTASL
jgi:peptide/nickel transport system permease protein